MTLAAGTRLGVYEIGGLLGAGGMGEVYRARDTRLGRDVAIKVLPASVAMDPERLARFEREARLLATLNHPNIGAIYGVEESSGVIALVLELVEGETLADRIAKGSGLRAQAGLPIVEALAIAQQIADALDAAHERGIVHRDLKPANVVVAAGGTVKVLDFGLAKGSATPDDPGDLTHSPTMIGPTLDGVMLGTAPYMSPEQARGKAVDKRTDIWAFGCVVYEMLTGRRAFAGETSSDVIAAILERAPDWSALPPSTPPHVVRALKRCLEKDPRRRLRDIGDVRAELDDDGAAAPAVENPPLKSAVVLLGLAVAILAAAVAGLWLLRPTSPPPRSTQFEIPAPSGTSLQTLTPGPIPSPDGHRVAFVARNPTGHTSIWMRAVESVTPLEIPGTTGANGPPFWSPDGRWLGFVADGKMKKVEVAGGPALNICNVQANLGATWNRDNIIVFAPVNRTVLHKVSAAGGTPEPITTLSVERKENSHRWPHFLPDGRHFLFTARSDVKENNWIYVGSLDSRDVKPIIAAQSRAMYAAGYLLFARDQTIMAQRFDARSFTLSGDAVAVAAHVNHNTTGSEASFSASTDGSVLAFLPNLSRTRALTWFDRAGRKIATVGAEMEYLDLRLSPDGRQAAVVLPDPDSGNRDIWRLDLSSGALTRLTTNPANDWQMVWSPDGREIAFASDRNGRSSVYRRSIDGGDETLVLRLPDRGVFPKDWSADGRMLALDIDSVNGIPSIWAMRLVGDRAPFSISRSTTRENDIQFSRDGRWLAFESDESGATEIYVAPFGQPGRRRVSIDGGTQPRWKREGLELYYSAPTGELMAVPFRGADPSAPGTPVALFRPCDGALVRSGPAGAGWFDVAAGSGRFLIACPSAGATPSSFTVSVDWAASLK